MRRGLPLLCLVLLAGCGVGGGGDDESLAPTVDRADLAIMVLPKESLGPLAMGVKLDDDSGPTDNEEAAEETIDPSDKKRTLARVGRLEGYKLVYSNAAAVERGEGILYASTSVELFRSEDAASAYLTDQTLDVERFRGKRIGHGGRLSEGRTFSLRDIGEEARGIDAAVRWGSLEAYGTVVGFRVGRIVAWADVGSMDERDVSTEVRRIARSLEKRIQGVLVGEITGEPVPLKREASKARKSQKRLDPRPLTLRAEDIGGGTSVVAQAYRKHGDVRGFVREFACACGRLGGSTVSYLRGMAQIMDSPSSADFFLGYADTLEGSRELGRRFIRRLLKLRPRNLLAGPLPTKRGDTVAITFSFETPRGRMATVMVYVRSGRAIGSLTAVGMGNELNPSDVIAFAGKIRARLHAR